MKSVGAPRAARYARARGAAWACALLLLFGVPAAAVVQSYGDGMGTITPPPDDPGFANVGSTGNGLTGVYIGNRWMLTAAHVGEQSLTLGGVTYAAVPGSLVQLQRSPGVYSDLVLVRLATQPPLPALVLSSASPANNDEVTMIGHAWDRAPNLICWNASWVEVSCPPPPNPSVAFRGFKSAGPFRIRWGRNRVKGSPSDISFGAWVTRGFEVQFDQSGIDYEAQGVPGDSGGAVFLKRGSQWELVGVMFSITAYTNQPYYSTAAFGQSTYAVDIAFYRTQIEAIVNAQEIPLLPAPLFLLCAVALAGAARLAGSGRTRRG